MAVLSIQSHVAYGRVGNRAAVFPLERLGFDVWPINTVQFSNHTGYGSWKGEVFPGSHIDLVWGGIRDRGVAGDCEAVLSGYLGDAATGEAILGAVLDVKAANPRALYCCDPVMGDEGRGYYVRPGIPEFIARRALPAADILTPNHFEAEVLAGREIARLEDAAEAGAVLRGRGPRIVLVTSFKPREASPGTISLFLDLAEGSWLLETPEIAFAVPPNGTGDLTTALFLGHYLKDGDPVAALEAASAAVYAVLERCRDLGLRELPLVAAQEDLLAARRPFKARRVR